MKSTLPPHAFSRFAMREHDQAIRLILALRGSRQREFSRPAQEVRRLREGQAHRLYAHNAFARERWMRALGGQLCAALGARAPRYQPVRPVWFVTLIDRRQIVRGPYTTRFPRPDPTFREIRRVYAAAMRGLDYVGLLDPALFVSTQHQEGVPRFIQWHLHTLVWNISRAELDAWAEGVRATMDAYLPGASSVDIASVDPEDLLQMLWYTAKMPRKQYQVSRRESGSLKQYKGQINGVNAVRLYAALRPLRLPHLTLAGGSGRLIRRRTLRTAARW
ncbi:hypothetical protein [Methylorubrum aminovorans]|uniref:hypothetical protein n=1 Tax=Methylorubrum aminovorans TaxID=269069 RepID=UPI003C2E475D